MILALEEHLCHRPGLPQAVSIREGSQVFRKVHPWWSPFHCSNITWENQLREKVYCSSQFHKFYFVISWPPCTGPVERQPHGETPEPVTHLLVWKWKRRQRPVIHSPLQGHPSSDPRHLPLHGNPYRAASNPYRKYVIHGPSRDTMTQPTTRTVHWFTHR